MTRMLKVADRERGRRRTSRRRQYAVLTWGFGSVVWALNCGTDTKFLGFGPTWINWAVLAIYVLFFTAVVTAPDKSP